MSLQLMSENEKLKQLGIDSDQRSAYEIVLLPQNVFDFDKRSELYDSNDARHLAKLLQASKVRCATIFDFGIDVPILERRSRDHRLGVVWIRDVVVLPLFIGVLSSMIATELGKPSNSRIDAKVHVELYLERGPNLTKLSYTGDGKTLIEMLRSIEPTKAP